VKKLKYDCNELENKKQLDKIYQNNILHDKNKKKINKCVSYKQFGDSWKESHKEKTNVFKSMIRWKIS